MKYPKLHDLSKRAAALVLTAALLGTDYCNKECRHTNQHDITNILISNNTLLNHN